MNKMNAHNLTVVICPNLVSSSNPMRDVMMCSIPNAPTLFDAARAGSHIHLPAQQPLQAPPSPTPQPASLSVAPTEGKTTLGMLIKLCIERYYEVFDEVPDRSEALVQEVARPPNPFADAHPSSPGSGSFQQGYNRDSALLDDDDIDDAMLVMPLGPGNRASLGQSNGAPGPSTSAGANVFRPQHRATPSAARSTHTHTASPPSAYASVTPARARSTISIERGSGSGAGPGGRKGSIALGRGTGTARGKSAGAGVQAMGITAAGFFTAPDAPPVPSLPSHQAPGRNGAA